MVKKIMFENAQFLREKYPETFEAPAFEDLRRLKPGNIVKVSAFNERFWTEIISIKDDIVTARVDNDLVTSQLMLNDVISFHLHNIYNIYVEPNPES